MENKRKDIDEFTKKNLEFKRLFDDVPELDDAALVEAFKDVFKCPPNVVIVVPQRIKDVTDGGISLPKSVLDDMQEKAAMRGALVVAAGSAIEFIKVGDRIWVKPNAPKAALPFNGTFGEGWNYIPYAIEQHYVMAATSDLTLVLTQIIKNKAEGVKSDA